MTNIFCICQGFTSKTLCTFGNCQRPVFSLGVSQHLNKTTNMCKFELNLLSMMKENKERTNTIVAQCFQTPEKRFKPEVFLRLKNMLLMF